VVTMALISCSFEVTVGTVGTSIFNITMHFILCTERIYAFSMVSIVNGLFARQQLAVYLYNGDAICYP
jgi:hypothetical protein